MESKKRAHEERKRHEKGKSKHARRRARKYAAEEDEERRLTSLLFGGSTSLPTGVEREQEDCEPYVALGFEIDRKGADATREEDDDDEGAETDDPLVAVCRDSSSKLSIRESDADNDEEDEERPVWFDEDDEKLEVDLLQTDRLRKLRKYRDEAAASALEGADLTERLRERYKSTMQRTARTDWAKVDESISDFGDDQKKEAGAEDSSGGPLLRTSSRRLPPNILSVVRCPDANQADPNNAVVQSVHFHPSSEPDRPLMLTAGLDKTLRFFQVGEEESVKVHGIHFPKMPIYSAQFVGKSGNVLVSGRRSFFYIYDAVAGKVDHIPRIIGRAEKSWERSVASPDGKTVAFCGNDGYVILFDIASKRTRAELKLNGSVRAITFSVDGEHVLASGSDGEVYRWDLRTNKCLERFTNEDGTITSSLATSSSHLSVGAESGVVNLFSGSIGQSRKPLKSIMNLHTSADSLRFNGDGQILAMSTRRDKQSLKLLHVPTATVFSNWPTSKTPLGYVWSTDFSPESKFLAVGNDKGKCLLYKLQHYSSAD